MSSNRLSLLVNFVAADKLSGALRNIIGLGRNGARAIKDLKGEGRNLENQLRAVRREIDGASGNVSELVNRERDLERQIEETNRALQQRARLNAIEADRRGMVARGEDLRQRGQENIVQGAALAAPLILAVSKAAEFSSGMVDIQQKAALSNRETDQLGRNILRMADAARMMPEDVRGGVDLLLARGMELDVATAAIGPAARLARAYKVEIPDAAAAAFASINNLKVSSAETARVFDVMAAAGNEGGFEVRDMASAFPSLTAKMQALGQTGVPAVADLSAALQVAMNTAGNADEAANNIGNLLSKINSPATITAFENNFGVNLPAALKRLEDQGYSSLEAIALVTQQATGGDDRQLGFAFGDEQARLGVMALIQNMEEYRRIRAAALASGGTVDRAFDQRVARDATVQWDAFKSSVSQLAITLGTTLLPVANQALGMITGLARSVARWAEANPEAAATITKIVAGLAVFKIGLGAAQIGIGLFMGPLSTMISVTQRLGGVARIFGVLRTAALFLGRGMMQAGMMMLANPMVLAITAVVIAIGVAAYLIYTHWDTIKAAFYSGVAWVQEKLGGLPNWLKNIGRMMMSGLLLAINPMALAQRLLLVARNGVNAFKDYLGIRSPSRLFMALGGHTAEGFARGIAGRQDRPRAAMTSLARGVAAAGALGFAGAGGMAAASAATPGRAPMAVTINVYQQPGQDSTQLAREIRRELQRLDGQAQRSSYQED